MRRPSVFPELSRWLAANGKTLGWLAGEMGIRQGTLSQKIHMYCSFNEREIAKMCEITGMTEEQLRTGELTVKEVFYAKEN